MTDYGSQMPQMVTPVEPYWLKRLVSLTGMEVLIDTTRNSLLGKLLDVEHDHIALQAGQGVMYIRHQEIVSVMPIYR